MFVCVEAKELKRARFIGCGRLGTQNTEEEREEEEEGGGLGFLNGRGIESVFLGPNRIPIVIEDDVRPLLYICGFLLINRLSRVASSLLVPPPGRHVWVM